MYRDNPDVTDQYYVLVCSSFQQFSHLTLTWLFSAQLSTMDSTFWFLLQIWFDSNGRAYVSLATRYEPIKK